MDPVDAAEQAGAAEAASEAPCEVTIVAHDVGGVGGMERQLAELVLGLRRLGHEVSVIAWTCDLPRDGEGAADAGVAFHRVRGPRRPFLVGYPAFMLAGSLVLRRRRRGIVQATGAIVLGRVDTVAIHCCHQVYRAAPTRSTRLAGSYTRLLGLIKRVAERAFVRANRSATFVCVSDGVAEEMREHYPEIVDRVVTIHNGVDTRAFAPDTRAREARGLRAKLDIPAECLIAAFVARGWGHKGLGSVIEALPHAPGWDLVVAGDGDRRRYEGLAMSLGVSGRVRWLGVVGDIQTVYELADAFVLPSSYETFSLVTFEAAASGLPILATAVNGVRELLVDGENGFQITPEPAVIAERMNRLSANSGRRREMGRAARRATLAFGWEEMVAEHHELYMRQRQAVFTNLSHYPKSSGACD